MSDDPTPLSLPNHLPYPIIITRLYPSSSRSEIQRGSKIFEYSFTSDTSRRALARLRAGKDGSTGPRKRGEGEEEGVGENDMIGSWESPIEGEFVKWGPGVKAGMVIERKYASRPVIYIQQPCTHPVQLHGLCGICGKELTENDYITPRTTVSNAAGPSKFPGAYEMGHDSLGVTVSSTEAKRLDTQARDDLLKSRRLALIVDLDQTIIHTTVDPTVGEWLEDVKSAENGTDGHEGDGISASPESMAKGKWKRNPNTEALKDVASFQLPDEEETDPRARRRPNERWYYTKPRPGLPAFLEKMSKMYEMHVYTMGTRTYADAICRAVDPDGKIFGGRILSRDESGSVKSKDLKRLFPTDQSMVVVIDDRGDVWGEIPNLVKVIPYDFFIGIGDINSNPSKKGVSTSGTLGGLKATPHKLTSSLSTSSTSPSTSTISTPPPISPLADVAVLGEEAEHDGSDAERKEERLHQVEEERPLKRLAEKMERERSADRDVKSGDGEKNSSAGSKGPVDEGESDTVVVGDKEGDINAGSEADKKEEKRSTTPEGSPPLPALILNPNDGELKRLSKILSEIHDSFYSAYDARSSSATSDVLPMGCDVELIIPEMKSRVLDGCRLVFSGIVPRGTSVEQSDIGILSHVYGARPLSEPSEDMTHCVCLNTGTEKTYRSNQLGKWVVKLDWMVECLAQWKRVDEGPYDCYPDTIKKGAIISQVDSGKAGDRSEGKTEEKGADKVEEGEGEGDFDDPGFAVGGWDAEAEREFEAFLEGSDDGISEVGSVASPPSSIPGTPRKRVRYADEEDLPLSSFRDPPHNRTSIDEGGESPERKRKIPIRLGPPLDRTDDVEGNKKLELSEKQKERISKQIEESQRAMAEQGEEVASEADTEGEDEFAKMLADSLDE